MKKFPLFNNGIWMVSAARAANGVLVLFVENLKTGFCDWPIQYADKHIAYDYPESIPNYVKRTVRSLFGHRKDKWARLEDCEGVV